MRKHTSHEKETILVVDDADEVRKMISEILSPHGYTVLEASNGVEALQVTDTYRNSIHLVLTDVMMPRMGGREPAERLLLANPRQRLIFMSGYTEDPLRNQVERLAVFLPKPFSSKTLVDKIREVLDDPACNGDNTRF